MEFQTIREYGKLYNYVQITGRSEHTDPMTCSSIGVHVDDNGKPKSVPLLANIAGVDVVTIEDANSGILGRIDDVLANHPHVYAKNLHAPMIGETK